MAKKPASTLLTIDVGNTATSFGVFPLFSRKKNPSPSGQWTLSTGELKHPQRLRQALQKAFRRYRVPMGSEVIVSSVVPSVDAALRLTIKRILRASAVHFVTAASKSRIHILYLKPSEVGADRIVNARGALSLKKGSLIVVDFGTATTFDCVTENGAYLGGVIAPGPVISAEALYQRTAKLPRVVLKKPVRILGRNTLESIQSGLFHGYRGLVREILRELKKKMGAKTTVIGTGGQAMWILSGLDCVDFFSLPLTHIGLYHFWMDAHGSFHRKEN